MGKKVGRPGVLLLTVGTGDTNKREETLYRPLRLSIGDGDWLKVILLPSHVTADWAKDVQQALAPMVVAVFPLQQAGDEDNADRCFDHFDKVLAQLREEGVLSDQIEVDPTRGTKMMSAALTLAAVRHDVPNVRYITGDRDYRGMVTPGSEQIVQFKTRRITAARRLEDGCQLFRHGNFAAVLALLPDPEQPLAVWNWPQEFYPILRANRALAHFYEAWDRLNYGEAHGVVLPEAAEMVGAWRTFYPSEAVREWIAQLAKPFPEGNDVETGRQRKASYLSRLVVDIWANGMRRTEQRQLEDAAVRAYRVLEMVGQLLLFRHGHDSARLDPVHAQVKEYVDYSKGKGNLPLSANKDGTLMAGRERVAGLLKRMGEPLAKVLIHLGNEPILSTRVRNESVLIHGFQARAPNVEHVRAFYRRLEVELLRPVCGSEGAGWFSIAQAPRFEG